MARVETVINERVTTRMAPETKELLERALVLSGYSSLNSFITNAAVTEAKKLIEQEMTINLSNQEAVKFLTALDKPRQPNQRFLEAALLHREMIENEGSAT